MAKLILVNSKDKEIGSAGKLKCHLGNGMLHRAFTVLLFNSKGELLIQKRSKYKLLWPLIWETTCSSHPLKNESYVAAAKKRLKKELGIVCQLKNLGSFQYQAKYKNIGAENELCCLLVGQYNGKIIKANKREVVEYKWISLRDLKRALLKNPKMYAPWLKIALKYYEKLK